MIEIEETVIEARSEGFCDDGPDVVYDLDEEEAELDDVPSEDGVEGAEVIDTQSGHLSASKNPDESDSINYGWRRAGDARTSGVPGRGGSAVAAQ